MSLTRTIATGSFWSGANNIVLKIVGLTAVFLILSKLSAYEYGLAELVFSLLPVVSIFSLPGMNSVILADLGRYRESGNTGAMRSLFEGFFIYQIALSVFAWAVLFFGADIIALFYSGAAPTLIKIVSFACLLSPLRGAVQMIFSVKLMFFELALYSFAEEIFRFVSIVLALFFFDLRAVGVVLALPVAQLLAISVLLPLALRHYQEWRGGGYDPSANFFSILRTHGKWSVFSTYVGSLTQSVRLWLIKLFAGTEAVGLFAAAFGLLGHANSLLPFSNILPPILSQYQEDKKRFSFIIQKAVKYQVIAACFVGVGVVIFLPFVLGNLLPHFLPSVGLFNIMVFTLVATAFSSVFTPVFSALRAQRSFFYSNVIKFILTSFLVTVLMPVYGIFGAALEVVITTCLLIFERYKAVQKIVPGFKIEIRRVFSFDELDKVLFQKGLSFIKSKI